jgi:hypothetical protein
MPSLNSSVVTVVIQLERELYSRVLGKIIHAFTKEVQASG